MTSFQEDTSTSIQDKITESLEDDLEAQERLDHFPDDFNQLELLETHRHMIPTGTQSQWPGESDDDDEEKTEEWYETQEAQLQNSPRDLLLFAAENNRLGTVKRVLATHPDFVNVTDEDLYTPLHRASYNGHLDVVRELISKGANIHAVTLDGWTPLHSACKWNNTAIASFLLQHGADINAQTEGSLTPLHLAAANRDSRQILELLLMNRYLNPHLTNKVGETAQEIARRTDVFHYLFEMTEYWT